MCLKKKLKNLQFIWRFRALNPWFVPTEQIRDYYGEKIALYFGFLGHYTKNLSVMGFLGLAVFFAQSFLDSKSVPFVVITVSFGFLQTLWGQSLVYTWIRKEKIFATEFGTIHKSAGSVQNAEQDDRPGFVGYYRRSPVTDALNSVYYSQLKRFMKTSLSMALCVLLLAIYSALIFGLLAFSMFLDYASLPDWLRATKLEVTVPALLNVIGYLIF